MTKWLLAAALILAVFPCSVMAQSKESLVGTWKLVPITLANEKGEVKDYFGPNPMGFLAITADGGMSIIMTRSGRRPLSSVTASLSSGFENVLLATIRPNLGIGSANKSF